ncbi:MAG: FAD:protein transferase [Candidatus Saccharibacteria bacterium]|nr:FAD:protein transferase [Candidatus Saccharibacteria bacterium]
MTTSAQRLAFEAIGTHWEIDIYDEQSPAELAELERRITKRIATFDQHYSRFRNDSLIMQASREPGRYKLPADATPLFELYRRLYTATHGKVTPLVGNLLVDAGYDPEYSLRPAHQLKPVPAWDDVMHYADGILTVKQPVIIDLGAAGKGYLIDLVAGILRAGGVTSYLIDAGGDLLHRGDQPARIGLEHPQDPTQAVGVVMLGNESICASAGNRRAWAGLHHIMDPHQAKPTTDVLATWVIAQSALLADGLATALFFTPAGELRKQFDFEYFLIRPDLSSEQSSGLQAEIFA